MFAVRSQNIIDRGQAARVHTTPNHELQVGPNRALLFSVFTSPMPKTLKYFDRIPCICRLQLQPRDGGMVSPSGEPRKNIEFGYHNAQPQCISNSRTNNRAPTMLNMELITIASRATPRRHQAPLHIQISSSVRPNRRFSILPDEPDETYQDSHCTALFYSSRHLPLFSQDPSVTYLGP